MSDSQAIVTVRDTHAKIESELVKRHAVFMQLAPATGAVERYTRIFLNALAREPRLMQCALPSLVFCFQQGVELGLELAGVMGEAFVIPFRNKGVLTATFVPGYKGLVKLALEHPKIDGMQARLVYDDDVEFAYEYGTTPFIRHVPKKHAADERRGTILAAYAVAFKTHGPPDFEVIERAELDEQAKRAERKLGKSFEFSPWNEHRDEMWRKSPVRRLCKYIPRTERLTRALEADGDPDPMPRTDNVRGEALKARLAVDAEVETET